MTQRLTTSDHSRDAAGLHYVYPVISRRAGGLSIGINFNTNNACNWRCIYCQVPDLKRGAPPPLDLELLRTELEWFLDQVLHGDFFDRFDVPEEQRVIKDIALSGNGEPTSLPEFAEAVEAIGKIAGSKGVFPQSRYVLISNGSLMHQARVGKGLECLNRFGGEVWFKLDSATREGRSAINHCVESDERVFEHLLACADICRTRVQTCLLNYRGYHWSEEEKKAYLQFLSRALERVRIEEVLLYTIARPSMQPEAEELTPMGEKEMHLFAKRIEELGIKVSVSR